MLITLNDYQSVHTKLHYTIFSNRFFILGSPPLKASSFRKRMNNLFFKIISRHCHTRDQTREKFLF